MEENYDRYLQKILKSEAFVTSSKTRDLLTYLLECTIKGTPPKETQIATEVFHRNLSENDQDTTIVRVNVHNLRKKLSHYYLTDGINDEIRFNIPTGRYLVEVVDNTSANNAPAGLISQFSKKQWLVYLLIMALTIGVSYFLFRDNNIPQSVNLRNTDFWNSFSQNGKKTMVVIGDYYYFKEKNPDFTDDLMVRNYSINSDEDFAKFLSLRPENSQKYSKANYSYTGYGTPFILKELLPVFEGTDYEICLMSQFNAKYLVQYNIIFVGLYKTLGILKVYLNHSGFTFDLIHNSVGIPNSQGKITQVFKQTGQAEEFHDDYAVAAKINGPNNNVVLLFCSFHDTGIVECVKEFTNPVSLKKIIKQVNISDKAPRGSFEILFKVIGVDRNDIKSEIIRINPLDSVSVFSYNK